MEWWGAEWRSNNQLDGDCRYIMHERGMPIVFRTRQEARHWINEKYGCIRHRKDLRSEPHGWRMPKALRIDVTVKAHR